MGAKRKRFNQTTIFQYFKARCKDCGTRENLTAHHKNHKPDDTRLKNFEILCLTCHRKREGVFYKKSALR